VRYNPTFNGKGCHDGRAFVRARTNLRCVGDPKDPWQGPGDARSDAQAAGALNRKTTMTDASTDHGSKEWLPYCRIMLEWLHPKRDLDPATWVEQVVARAEDLKVDALAFDFYHGGYAIFDGTVAPKDGHVGDADLLALLDEAVHRRGMRLVAMNMGQHCACYTAGEYPTWRMRDGDGKNPEPGFFPSYKMCLNTPYADFLLQELAGMLPRYRIDGLYIEGLYGQHCYCDYCCTEFERTYGYAIPRDKGARGADPNYGRFRAATMSDFVRRLRRTIDAASPRTALIPCPSSFPDQFTDLADWGRYADAIELERQWGHKRFGLRLPEIGLSMQVVRAESGRHPMGTLWLGWNVDRDYSPCTAEQYRLNFMEILLYGATPQLHAQTIFEVDASGTDVVREMFGIVEQVRPYLLDASLVPYAALVVDYADFSVSDHARGLYQALIEHHVPFEVISRRDLAAGRLERFRVLLLPNVARLGADEVAGVANFHAAGGGVVLTYRTGCGAGEGHLPAALAALAGVRGPFGIVTNPAGTAFELLPSTYYKVTADHAIGAGTRGRLQSFQGSWAEVEADGGTVIAEALDYDFSKMHRHHPVFGWYPGRPVAPLIVARQGERGAGRAVYFAGEFDRASWRACLPGTLNALAEAAVWAAGQPPPVSVACSPNVEAATHYSPTRKAYVTILVNRATNDLSMGMIVRHVETMRDVALTIAGIGPTVTAVRSLAGAPVAWRSDGEACAVSLGYLRDYDVLIVEAGGPHGAEAKHPRQ